MPIGISSVMPFDVSYGPIKVGNRSDTRLSLALFGLACCRGLRASEIAYLQIGDVRAELARPHIFIRNGAS
jgi:hypothetical protein